MNDMQSRIVVPSKGRQADDRRGRDRRSHNVTPRRRTECGSGPADASAGRRPPPAPCVRMGEHPVQAGVGGARALAQPSAALAAGAAGAAAQADTDLASARSMPGQDRGLAAGPGVGRLPGRGGVAGLRGGRRRRGVRQSVSGRSHGHDGRSAADGGLVTGRCGCGSRCHEGRRDQRDDNDQLSHAAPPRQSDSTGSSLPPASAWRLRAVCARAVRCSGDRVGGQDAAASR